MDYSSAEMTCVLKMNTQCEGCKAKVMQILRNIRGVYNITVDGEQGTVKVTGRVNPSTLLGVLEKYGKHAEVKYINIDGEVVERNPPHYYGEYGHAPYGMECSYPQHQCYPASLGFSPPLLPPPPPTAPIRGVPLPPPPPLAPLWAPPPRPYGPPPYMVPFWTPHPPRHTPTPGQNRKMHTKRNHCAMM